MSEMIIPDDEVIGEFEIFKQKVRPLGGVRFLMSEHDSQRITQNNGVMVIGKSNASGSCDNNFYGVLDEVLHVQYLMERSVWLFKCRWYDTDIKKSYQVFYLDDPKNGSNWKVVQVVQNKLIWDVSEVNYVENEELNALKIVVGHRVDEHNEDDTLCTMSSFPSGFDEIDAMFLEFAKDLNNSTRGSSSVGDNYKASNAPGAEKLILQYAIRFSQAIGVCVMKTFSIHCLRFLSIKMLTTFKEFKGDYHRHFKKYSDPEEAHVNHRTYWWDNQMLELQSGPTLEVLDHSLETRYARLCWVEDRVPQKALIGDLSPSPARRPMLAVPRPRVRNLRQSSNYKSSLMKLNERLKKKERHQRC
ncbi:uncharacterized protein E5676_scaffold142G001260 [Cucumis melo var. makuwa]|uniref:CACTA en-spm transposon protein n=1 Tax=Cucumis melo var. makuwa TaxID=1194695 RepID=A0A5D3DIQ8_CUCMM|nr:uncharacterized protein E5676_scaffold142G001260 [Cucumis melo var. makuwa]